MAQSSTQDKSPIALVRDMSLAQTLIAEGKAFHVSNPTAQTAVVGQTSHALTLATIYLGNRGAKAMVPLWARFSQVGTVAGARIFTSIKYARVDQFTSGTANTVEPLNGRTGLQSQVTAAHTATIPTFTAGNAMNLGGLGIFQSVSAVVTSDVHELLPFPGCIVVNPGGALYIYTNAGTTGPGWEYDVAWAEIEVA